MPVLSPDRANPLTRRPEHILLKGVTDHEFVSVVYMPDRISHCRATCGETNHSAGQITRR